MDAPERIWAIFEKHHSGRGHPHVLATCEKTKGYKYRRADLCADPALLAEAVEVINGLFTLLDAGAVYEPQTIAARAFLAKLENRHDR